MCQVKNPFTSANVVNFLDGQLNKHFEFGVVRLGQCQGIPLINGFFIRGVI